MIAREGLPFILIGLAVTTVLAWASLMWDNWWLLSFAALLFLLTLFTLFFFRDPPRFVDADSNELLSPGDGRILGIETVKNHPYLGGDALKISIFLSILDVHINRIPATGKIDFVRYNPGRFFPAFKDKASELNEHTEIGLTTGIGHRIVFKQIAGIIARRIVCKVQKGDAVVAGARFGMIRFGSRVELFVPVDSELLAKEGDHVKGGKTILGCLPNSSDETNAVTAARVKNAEL
jgi:phosphatidylserine decarboxylase